MSAMKMTNAKDTESKDASELLGDETGVAAFAPLDNAGAPAPAVGDKPGAVAGGSPETERPQRAEGGAATLQTEGRAAVRRRFKDREVHLQVRRKLKKIKKMEAKKKDLSSHWWWFDSHKKGNLNRSPWLQSTLAELDEKTKAMLKVIEEDADSFAQRAEMYYRKRPELISMVEDFYRTHRSLAERFDQAKSEPLTRISSPWLSSPSSSPLSFTKYRLQKSLSLDDKAYDSYSEACGPDESDESEVDDPEEPEEDEILQNPVINYETEEVFDDDANNEELIRLRDEVERLKEENKVQKEQLMQKDEEKREVIRQLSLGMDLLRDENAKLRRCFVDGKSAPKKGNRAELSKAKEGFFGRMLNGFGKANLVAL